MIQGIAKTDTNKSGLNLEGAKISYYKNLDVLKSMDKKKLIFEQIKRIVHS